MFLAGFTNVLSLDKTDLASELQNQYSEKCDEMVSSLNCYNKAKREVFMQVSELKHVLDGQTSVFVNYYSRFASELKVDNEAEATIPKFDEIRKHVTELEDMNAIESYLARIVKQKEAWKAASVELRTLGRKND